MKRLELKSGDGRETLVLEINWLGVFEWTPLAFHDEIDKRDDGTIYWPKFNLHFRCLPCTSYSKMSAGRCHACINHPIRSRIAVLWNWLSHKLRNIPLELLLLAYYLGWATSKEGYKPVLKLPWRKAA